MRSLAARQADPTEQGTRDVRIFWLSRDNWDNWWIIQYNRWIIQYNRVFRSLQRESFA